MVGDLVAEVADQAASREAVADDLIAQELKVATESLQRLDPLVGQVLQAPGGAVALQGDDGERLLALEVVVEGSLGGADRVGDVLDACGVEPEGAELRQCRLDDLLAHALPGHTFTNQSIWAVVLSS